MSAKAFLEELRRELSGINKHVLEHPILRDAENGNFLSDIVKAFVENQYYIVRYDALSLAFMASRALDEFEARYFNRLAEDDLEAF